MFGVLNVELYNDDETLYSSSESGDVVSSVLFRFFSFLFLLLRAVLMNHSFDIVRLEKKRQKNKKEIVSVSRWSQSFRL